MSEIQIRRMPTQARSRERVELILRTARELIGERGNDAVSMREIATAAGVPIGSVYQYFPDKSTLLFTIMEEYYERIRAALQAELEALHKAEDLPEVAGRCMQLYTELFREDPLLSNIWAGTQADPRLVEQDMRDSYRNADLFSKAILGVLPALRKSDVKAFTLFFSHVTGSVVRFAKIAGETDGKSLLKEAQKLVELRLADLVRLAKSRKKG
jgi:AcrR family transcriptional regulator